MEKTELIEALEDGHAEMLELLENLADEVFLEPGVCGTWSIKDVLAHLTQWEGQTVTLLFQAKRGDARPTTAHFSKETDDEINQRWYEASKERPLAQIWQDWEGVRKQTIRRVNEYNDSELNDPNLYAWLDKQPLWQWICGSTIEHEDEHSDAIREWLDKRDSTAGSAN